MSLFLKDISFHSNVQFNNNNNNDYNNDNNNNNNNNNDNNNNNLIQLMDFSFTYLSCLVLSRLASPDLYPVYFLSPLFKTQLVVPLQKLRVRLCT